MVSPLYNSHKIGNGPIVIELWLDYLCPFSAKMFKTVYESVIKHIDTDYPHRFQWVFCNYVQPWHPQGGWVHEVALAVGQIHPQKFWEFSNLIFENQSMFFDSAIADMSRADILMQLFKLAAECNIDTVALTNRMSISQDNSGTSTTPDLKYFTKLGRSKSIHVTPTVLIDDLQDAAPGSSWTVTQWIDHLGQVFSKDILT